MRRGSGFLVLLLVSACGGGLERVSFTTDLLSYRPGGRVGLSVANVGATALNINLCVSRLVSEDGATRGPEDGASCVLEVQPLKVGQRIDERKTLPMTTPPGTWRYETTIRLLTGEGEKVLTPPFAVVP